MHGSWCSRSGRRSWRTASSAPASRSRLLSEMAEGRLRVSFPNPGLKAQVLGSSMMISSVIFGVVALTVPHTLPARSPTHIPQTLNPEPTTNPRARLSFCWNTCEFRDRVLEALEHASCTVCDSHALHAFVSATVGRPRLAHAALFPKEHLSKH